MSIEDLRNDVEELEKMRDAATEDKDKKLFQRLIDEKNAQILELERKERTPGQKRGAGIGRVAGLIVGTLTAPIEDALDGNTDRKETQRRRRRLAEGGEHVGEAIGGFVEALRKRKKK